MKDFVEKLIVTNRPSDQQRQKETWDIEGILHNQKYKFDLRPIKNNHKIANLLSAQNVFGSKPVRLQNISS